MLPPHVGWYELLTLDAEALVERGLRRDLVVTARLTYTGTERVWSARWARTVGSWGRVRDRQEIAQLADVDHQAVRTRAKSWKLKYATTKARRTQTELALLCYFDRDRPADTVCRGLGILEVERRWYCCATQLLCDERGWSPRDLLVTDVTAFAAAWDASGLELGPPPPERFDITDTAALQALVASVKASM